MNRNVKVLLTALVLAACLIFGVCAFAEETEEECKHEVVKTYEWLENCTYEPIDDKYHYTTGYVGWQTFCMLCSKDMGYGVSETLTTVKEKHYFTNRVCVLCDAENKCAHEYIIQEDDCYVWTGGNTYTDMGNGTHEITGNGYVSKTTACSVCGEVWETNTDEGYMEQIEKHYYNNGVCGGCGARNPCDHIYAQSSEEYASSSIYIPIDAKTHRVTGKKQTVVYCPQCMERWYEEPSEEEYTEIQKHDFSYPDGVCNYCGQKNTCPHENVVEQTAIRGNSAEYTARDERYHTYSAYIDHLIVCEDCDAIVDKPYCSYESNVKEEHNFINGYCECGYVQIVDDLFDGSVAYLPDSLKVIDEEALLGIAARTVVIPDGATTIAARAFASCPNLKYVVIPESVDSIAGSAFNGCSDDLTIITTYGSLAESYAEVMGISCITR